MVSRRSLVPWWPAVWLVTSMVVVVLMAQIESGWFLAAFYIGLNACTVLYVALGDGDGDGDGAVRGRQLTIVGWCVAAQLPAMLWLFVNARRAPERLHAQKLADGTERAKRANVSPRP